MLWVRSQDRDHLVKVERFEIDKTFLCSASNINNDQLVKLGEYSTEDRVLEILDKIHTFIDDREWSKQRVLYHSNIFEMPEE